MCPFVLMINIYVKDICLNTCMYLSVPILQLSFMSFLAVIPLLWHSSLKIDFLKRFEKGKEKLRTDFIMTQQKDTQSTRGFD